MKGIRCVADPVPYLERRTRTHRVKEVPRGEHL